MAGFVEIASAAIAFGLLVIAAMQMRLKWKQHRKANDDEWKSSAAYAFLKAHTPSEGGGGPQAQEQFDIDATLQGANYLDAGPWETLEFPDESRLYCLDQNRCQWVRAITLGARLRRFLRDARSPHP